MRSRLIPALAAVALVLAPLSACASPSFSGIDAVSLPASGFEVDVVPEGAASGDFASESRTVVGTSVIRTGDISIVVDDVTKSAEQVREIAEGFGGSLESESVSGEARSASASASLTVLVPADRFDAAFESIGEVGDVRQQNRSATDVTVQHADLQARVNALEASIERLTELMRGAASTGELIEAEAALSQRQQDLDGMRAQLEALESQVNQATIWVQLGSESTIPGGPDNFWDGLLLGIGSLGTAAAGALVVLGVALPWLVVLGAVAGVTLLIIWLARRGRRQQP